jgi:hypothetical protein
MDSGDRSISVAKGDAVSSIPASPLAAQIRVCLAKQIGFPVGRIFAKANLLSLLFGEFSGLLKRLSRRIRRTSRELALMHPEKRRNDGFRATGLLIVHALDSGFYLGTGSTV